MDARLHRTDSIRPFGLQPGPNNNESILIPISIDTLVTLFIKYYVYNILQINNRKSLKNMDFSQFWPFVALVLLNFSRTKICTAKPMVVGCGQHYSTHFIKKLDNFIEPLRNIEKSTFLGQKWQFLPIFCPRFAKFQPNQNIYN